MPPCPHACTHARLHLRTHVPMHPCILRAHAPMQGYKLDLEDEHSAILRPSYGRPLTKGPAADRCVSDFSYLDSTDLKVCRRAPF